jgi:hypothetical protein
VRATMIFVGALGLAACAAEYREENVPLYRFSGVQQQIKGYYDDNATEEDWTCNEVQMDNIDESSVVGETAAQVKLAVHYYFSSFDESPGRGGNQCQGFNTRFFTFDRGADGTLTLASMSGPQRRP